MLSWSADGGYPESTAYIEGIAAYNAQVPASERFSGAHLDYGLAIHWVNTWYAMNRHRGG